MHVTDKYGLLIRREIDHGTSRVIAEIVIREDAKDHPVNPSTNPWDDDMPKHFRGLLLDGLAMRGFVMDSDDCPFIGFSPEFYNRYATDLSAARRMVKTLQHIQKRGERDAAHSAVDQFTSMCAALKLDFVVTRVTDDTTDSSWRRNGFYHDSRWAWMTIGEGRNAYRRMIDEARVEALAKRQPTPATA